MLLTGVKSGLGQLQSYGQCTIVENRKYYLVIKDFPSSGKIEEARSVQG